MIQINVNRIFRFRYVIIYKKKMVVGQRSGTTWDFVRMRTKVNKVHDSVLGPHTGSKSLKGSG